MSFIAQNHKPLLLLFLLVVVACAEKETETAQYTSTQTKTIPDKIDFNYHVRPILSDRCYTCHGPDEASRQAGLRLDIEADAFAAIGENKDHYAIVKGDVAASALVSRIYETDPTEQMPPPESNLVLEPYEKEILKRWIEQGAEWKTHWSFIPPAKTNLPKVQNTAWPQNEIDYFILSQLEAQQLKPSEKASKEQLIRRLSFDLTGLSPTKSGTLFACGTHTLSWGNGGRSFELRD